MKLMKLDPFTIFLIILGVLVIITLVMNLFDSYKKETFINFQNHPQASGSSIHIPQYTTNQSHKQLSLYDNIYFDTKNGTLIELFANSCITNCQSDPKNITDIVVASRNGVGITAVPTVFDNQGNVKPNSTAQSMIDTIEPSYNQYIYTTSCKNTNIYQVLYASWNKDTYIHIIDISGSGTGVGSGSGKNIKSFYLTSTGIESSQDTFTTPLLQPLKTIASTLTENKNTVLPSSPNQKYSQGNISLLQLGKDGNQNSVSYDVSNGNIVINNNGILKVYNRNGTTVNNTQPNNVREKIPSINTFVISDISGLNVLVTSYNDDTLIQLIVPDKSTNYKLLYSYRFNKTSYITNFESDTKNNPALTPAPSTPVSNTTAATSAVSSCTGPTPAPPTTSCTGPTPAPPTTSCLDKNKLSNLDENMNMPNNMCGDDLAWNYSKSSQHLNDSNYFSDDYFLKTQVVPPVCPRCPECPSFGACNNCGGNGGCGTVGVTTPPTTTGVTTPPTTTNNPVGSITDKIGNIYVPYTDSSGNTKYMMSSTSKSAYSSDGSMGIPKGTYLDSEGNLITSANPNSLVGGLTTTALGVTQVGTTGINTAGNVANNLIDTAGRAVDSTTGLVTGAIGSTTGLVGGLANTAGNVVGGLANTAENIVGGLTNTAGGIVGNTTNMIGNLGRGYGGNMGGVGGNMGGVGGNMGGVGGAMGQGTPSFGCAPSSNMYTPGYAPIDNYSQYGALQSKGSNYMPITADFSSFRK